MTGTLEHLGGDKWRTRVYVGTLAGREIVRSKSFTAAGRRAAEREKVKHVAAILSKMAEIEKVKGTVNELVQRYEQNLRGKKRSPHTMYRMKSILREVRAELGTVPLSELSAYHIDQFYAHVRNTPGGNGRERSEATVHHYHRVVHAILRMGERYDMLPRPIVSKLDAPERVKTEVKAPSTATLELLLSDASYDLYFPALLAAWTGLRQGELIGLRWSDLDGNVLHVRRTIVDVPGHAMVEKKPKSGAEREVVVHPVVLDELTRHRQRQSDTAMNAGATLADDGPIIADMKNDPTGRTYRRPGWLALAWRRHNAKHGLHVRFHDLRHWTAVTMLGSGVGINDTQRSLGHAQASTTLNIYGSDTPEGRQRAVGIVVDALPPRR